MKSKIDLDYAYGQTPSSEADNVHSLQTAETLDFTIEKKRCYWLAEIPTKIQEKIDRTLECCSSAWLKCNIVVSPREDGTEHEIKIFDELENLEKQFAGQIEENRNFAEQNEVAGTRKRGRLNET